MARRSRSRRLLATSLQRIPFVASSMQHLVRRLQGRFTVGAVGVLLDDKERVLLVEHVFHPEFPWGPPGGWSNRNELPQRTVEREFKEETNLDIISIRPLNVWKSARWRNHLNLAFLVELANPNAPNSICLSGELLDYQWASHNALPPMFPEHIKLVDIAIKFHREVH